MKTTGNAAQGNVEYALILILIALAGIIFMQIMGVSVQSVYCTVAGDLGAKDCGATTICQDDFNTLSQSLIKSGNWTIQNGKLCNTGGGGMIYNSCSMSNSMFTVNYIAALNGANLTNGNGYGIFFHATDNGSGINGYAFQYDPGIPGYVFRKWVNGSEIFNPVLAITYVNGYNWYAQPHNLSVKVVGNTFIGYVDGVPVLTATDPDNTFPTGGSAIRTWDSTVICIDQFTLNPVP